MLSDVHDLPRLPRLFFREVSDGGNLDIEVLEWEVLARRESATQGNHAWPNISFINCGLTTS